MADIKALAQKLVDIHGAHSNQSILEEAFQRKSLDSYGEIQTKGYGAAYDALQKLNAELAELESDGGEDELDLLRYQTSELNAAELTEDDETLAERHAAAAHAGEIIEASRSITEALGGDRGAGDSLFEAQRQMRAIIKHFPEAEAWINKAEELSIELQELSRAVVDSASKIESGEESLEELDHRLTLVNKLKRKYNAVSVAELIEKAEAKRQRLERIENKGEKIEELREKIVEAKAKLAKEASLLTKARAKAAKKLGSAVTIALHDLGFLKASFSIELKAIDPQAHGADEVIYMFEPNPGEAARPLADIASSGETARVMLALKATLAEHDGVGTLVFDEIDANIGGEVGRVVGEKLRSVARHHQVITITHLPQSAVFGEKHFVVSKSVEGGRTKSRISEVSGENRVKEITRMLGGMGSVVRKHAEELLSLSR